MESTIQKTIVFGIFILIGLLLKYKITSKSEKQGIKKIVLNIALPATIFIALMNANVDSNLLGLPILALTINIFLFYVFPWLLPFFGIQKNTSSYRTLRLMIPSLAPGLSCFPFIAELLGQEYLAKAAMADLGNKIFVLIILYLIAIQWYIKKNPRVEGKSNTGLRNIFKTLISEPVTVLLLIALGMLSFGVSFDSLPSIIQEVMQKFSLLMTPLVMLFIGLTVNIKKQQLVQLLSILIIRAGLVLLFSSVYVQLAGISISEEVVWIVAFSLSACSFWPYAHIASISQKEQQRIGKELTFNGNFAINLLALSFPLSTLLIVSVMLNPDFVAAPVNIFISGITCIGLGMIPVLIKYIKLYSSNTNRETVIKFDYKKVWQLWFKS